MTISEMFGWFILANAAWFIFFLFTIAALVEGQDD
jgi:hypothetical protein